jgi:phospholipase C
MLGSMQGRSTRVMAALAAGTLALACSADASTAPAPDATANDIGRIELPPPALHTPPLWNLDYPRPTDSQAALGRLACDYKRGAMPAQTFGPATLLGPDLPIQHVVVVMQENHSFDEYFAHLPEYAAATGHPEHIDVPPPDAGNPTYPVGGATRGVDAGPESFHPLSHAPLPCISDPVHGWASEHQAYDDGRNDGFFFMSNGHGDSAESTQGIAPEYLSGSRALWWYDQRDIPFYYELFSTFAISDRYFSALLGPTYPNRMYLYAATSFGQTDNVFPNLTSYPFPGDGDNPAVLFDELTLRGVHWGLYSQGPPAAGTVLGTQAGTRYGFNPKHSFDDFLRIASRGELPTVAFVDSQFWHEGVGGDDEHPPADIQVGQRLVWQVVEAVMSSPEWGSTALFITYDENGGTYDHVAPPSACIPDDVPPTFENSTDALVGGTFDRYGFRVPFVVVSPYAKRSYVSHVVLSHSAITRFIETLTTVPALTARDANANPLDDLFDWQSPPFLTSPRFVMPEIDSALLAQCRADLTPTMAN